MKSNLFPLSNRGANIGKYSVISAAGAYIFATILFFSVIPPVFGAADAQVQNAGFVPANIWYSKDPFFAEDNVRVYTVIFNGSKYDLTGAVEFLDNGIIIGRVDFVVSKGGGVRDVWVAWKATEGKHLITARMVGVTTIEREKKVSVLLENTETGKSERTIDFDTDGDGIGNTADADDDNDGIFDIDEVRNGTDPLKKDTDGNGISDKEEIDFAKKNATTTSLASQGSIANAIKAVEDVIPAPVKEGVARSVNVVERFRVGEGYQFRLSKEEKIREITSIKAREDAFATSTSKKNVTGATDAMLNAAEKPFAYVLFAIFTVLQYAFEQQIVFYGIILYILYRLFKWLTRRT